MTEGPLVPIEVESDDAEGSGEVEEGTMGQVEEEAVPQLWRNNQSRAAGWRVVHVRIMPSYPSFSSISPYLLQDLLS